MIAESSSWSLLDPWLLLVIPAVWAVFAWRTLRAAAALPTASVGVLTGLPRSLRARLWRLPVVLLALALTAFALALARPVSRAVLPLRNEGVDILLCMDVSSSMMATDMDDSGRETRMKASRERALEFAATRKNDRVGLLTFALCPEVQCPLTLDQVALAAFLRSVRAVPDRSSENMTGIGVALAKATTLLENSEAASKVIILLSDGENNVTDILPDQAAKLAKDAGIHVHCIGLGRGRVVEDPFFGRREYQPEFTSLRSIAKITAGEFHKAETGDDLRRVYDRINELEKVELEDPRYRTVELFLYPFAVGVGLLLAQFLLEFLWIRRLP